MQTSGKLARRSTPAQQEGCSARRLQRQSFSATPCCSETLLSRRPPHTPFAAILLLFYSSPLSTILLVLRTRNSSSLQLPLSVMNIINGAWWQRGVFWGTGR